MQWMKANTSADDRSKVAEYMRDTALYRQQWIKSNKMSATEIFEEFPRLADSGMVRILI